MEFNGEDTFQNRVKDIISRWLAPEFSLKDIAADGDGNASWAVQADDGRRHVLVVALKKAGDHVVLEGRVAVGDVHQAQLQAMEPAARRRWLLEMERDLTSMGLDQNLNDPLTLIRVQQHVYVDGGMVKDTFMQRVHEILRGVAFIQMTVKRDFD